MPHAKKMPGELFCIKTALHKRREKTPRSIAFLLSFFQAPWGYAHCQRQGNPVEIHSEGSEMTHDLLSLTALRGGSQPSHTVAETILQTVKGKCPFVYPVT